MNRSFEYQDKINEVVIGTRGSKLALAQANKVKESLLHLYPSCIFEIFPIKTTGDTLHDQDLSEIDGKGLFLKEIEEALLDKRIDIAVHSMKDVPYTLPDELIIDSFLKRDDPRDAFISFKYDKLSDLPVGGTVGTSSSRRKSLLQSKRSDLEIIPIRGNIDTRIAKLKAGEVDAIILAFAGLKRLNLGYVAKQVFEIDYFLPAVGQGIIGIQRRVSDKNMKELVKKISDKETAICLRAERSFLKHIGGDCRTPIAAYANLSADKKEIKLLASLAHRAKIYTSFQSGKIEDATILGKRAANEIMSKQLLII